MSLTQRGIEHYCNSSERSIKPSVRETTLSSKPLCKDNAWQKSLPSENTVYFLSVSVYVFVSQHVCVFGRWKSGEETKVDMNTRRKKKVQNELERTEKLLGLTSGAADIDPQSQAAVAMVMDGRSYKKRENIYNTSSFCLLQAAVAFKNQLCQLSWNPASGCPQQTFLNLLATPTRHELMWVTAAEERILDVQHPQALCFFLPININQYWHSWPHSQTVMEM